MQTRYLLIIWANFLCVVSSSGSFNLSPSRGETSSFDGDESASFEIQIDTNMLRSDDQPVEKIYCSSFDAEPSVWDILTSTTPGVIKSTFRTWSASPSSLPYSDLIALAANHIMKQLSIARLPLRAIFGTGFFRISFNDRDSVEFSAIELFVPQPLVLRSVCLWMRSRVANYALLHPVISMLCSCSQGVMTTKALGPGGRGGAAVPGCLLHPCTSRDAQQGMCIVEVDALTTSYIYGPHVYKDSVAYELRVPTMQILPSVSSITPHTDHTSTPPGWRNGANSRKTRDSSSSAAIVIPLRAARLLLALLFMRVSYAKHLISLSAKVVVSVWAAITISSMISAW
jgi:hypothetical protein